MTGNAEGHRERLRKRFLESGGRGFSDREMLELLLTFARPRKDVREEAADLLERFGSLDGVFRQSPDMLMTSPGIGPAAATLLSMVTLASQRAVRPAPGDCILDSVEKVKAYLAARLARSGGSGWWPSCSIRAESCSARGTSRWAQWTGPRCTRGTWSRRS